MAITHSPLEAHLRRYIQPLYSVGGLTAGALGGGVSLPVFTPSYANAAIELTNSVKWKRTEEERLILLILFRHGSGEKGSGEKSPRQLF